MFVPGWQRLSDYAYRNGDWTICHVSLAEGWRFELWKFQEQIEVNLMTVDAALEKWRHHSTALQNK
jgi:hypothetical protein